MATSGNVSAGKPKIGGAVNVGATSLTAPTNASSTLAAGFTNLGYISEDGLTNANERNSEDIKAWGGDIVLSIQDEKTDTFSFTMIEALSADVLKVYFGDGNVSGTLADGTLKVTVNSDELPEKMWVIDMVGRGNTLHRVVIPRGKVTTTEEISYVDAEAIGYGVTITAYPDTTGNTHYEYFAVSGS